MPQHFATQKIIDRSEAGYESTFHAYPDCTHVHGADLIVLENLTRKVEKVGLFSVRFKIRVLREGKVIGDLCGMCQSRMLKEQVSTPETEEIWREMRDG